MTATLLCLLLGTTHLPNSTEDSLPQLRKAPASVKELWAGYDPEAEPLQVQVVREWREDGVTFRYVTFHIGTLRGQPATMAAFYAFPTGASDLPAVMHLHGGGQRAFQDVVRRYAQRGYAALSVNWGGRPMEDAQPTDPNTNWGGVDPTQNNVGGYSSLLPSDNTLDSFPSPRNNNWFLLTLGCRRGLTFLQQQAEVDPDRLGVFGHSMGGRLTCLVAGTDRRVKVAAPSVGGSGFLQTDLWGLPHSARRVRGDLPLFQNTISGQAYLQRIRCPILFLSATNDFNAPMDFVEKGMALVPHSSAGQTYAPHLNHRFTPETEIARPLWLDAHLQDRLEFPDSPQAELVLETENGIPKFRVTPDPSMPIDRVEIYYGYARDPRNRFWADGKARLEGDVWEAACPVFDLQEPLFVFANVYYLLTESQSQAGDPETFALSVAKAAYPSELSRAKVQATERTRLLIDDFARGFHDWYTLNIQNPHHWFLSTRKLVDPRWEAPSNATLQFKVRTNQPENTLAVQLKTDTWRSYSGRKPMTWTALIPLTNAGMQQVEISLEDFTDESGEPLKDWYGITELIIQAGAKAQTLSARDLAPWSGEVPEFFDLRWSGGEPTKRRKPYLPDRPNPKGLNRNELENAIDDSINRENIDRALNKAERTSK